MWWLTRFYQLNKCRCTCRCRWNKFKRQKNWTRFPTGTCSCSECLRSGLRSGWWSWPCTRTCLVFPLRFFRSWCVCGFRGGSFSICCSGLCSWMRVADLSDVRCTIAEGFATGCASKRTFFNSLFVRLQVTIESGLLCEPFLAAVVFVRFLSTVN